MSTDRREFLGAVFAAGFVPKTLTASPILPANGSPTSAWDVSWIDKLAPKRHRAVFDSPEIGMGLALLRSLIWIKDYGEVHGTRPEEMGGVVVLRHNAIWLAVNDAFWNRFKVGDVAGIRDPTTRKPIRRNPYLGANIHAGLPGEAMERVMQRALGAATAVLACNLAFQDVVAKVTQDAQLDDLKARELALAHLVPGVLLQPSGVFAVTRAQDAGCRYMLAS